MEHHLQCDGRSQQRTKNHGALRSDRVSRRPLTVTTAAMLGSLGETLKDSRTRPLNLPKSRVSGLLARA